MRRLLILGLGVLIMLTLCSCTKPSAQETPAVSTQQPDVQQKNVEIAIDPPDGWEPVDGSVLPVQYLKSTVSFMVKEEKFQGKTLDDVIIEAQEAFENAFEDVKYEGDATTVTIDGKDARQMLFTCTISGMKMKYEYVYLFAGGKVYAITFGGPADTFATLSADYAQILKDIRFE